MAATYKGYDFVDGGLYATEDMHPSIKQQPGFEEYSRALKEEHCLGRLHYLRISACKDNVHAMYTLGMELLSERFALCDPRCGGAGIKLLERAAAFKHISAFEGLMEHYKAKGQPDLEYKWGSALVEMFLQADHPLCAWEWIVKGDNRRRCSPMLEFKVRGLQACFVGLFVGLID